MATQRTWSDLADYLTEFDKREGASPARALYLILGNEALGVLSERVPLYKTSWDNDTGGDLTISGNVCTLPIDLTRLISVEWDGDDNPLERTTIEWLDSENGERGWRSETGDPERYAVEGNQILFNAAPTGTVTGKLVIRGVAYLPDFSETIGATNPLTYLPARFQMLPAQYIISKLPVNPVKLDDTSAGAAQWAIAETQRRTVVRAEAKAEWERGLLELSGQHNRRRFREFSF